MKFWNDYGSTFAMADPVKDAKQGQTFMVFAQIKGIAGDVTTDCSDRNIIPYYKGTWASLRRVDSIDEYKRTVYQATLFRGNGQQRRGHGVTVPLSRVRLKELVEEVARDVVPDVAHRGPRQPVVRGSAPAWQVGGS